MVIYNYAKPSCCLFPLHCNICIIYNCKRFSIFSYLKKEKKWSFNYISIDLPLQTSKVLQQKEIIILFQEINCYQKVNK